MNTKPNLPEAICKNVLLVDDEEIDLFINEKIMTTSNFAKNVHKTESGRVALEYLKKVQGTEAFPELIFLDLNMPIMNGFDFLASLERLNEFGENCKVVILTSSASDDDRTRAMKYGMVTKFISKPINDILLRELKKMAGEQELQVGKTGS